MSNLVEKLDTIFSKYIRLKYIDENGIGYCYTCSTRLNFKTAECGHYPAVSRGDKKYRWNRDIHKIQCNSCNCFKDGEEDIFRDKLINEFGSVKLAYIEFDSKKNFKWFKCDMKQLLKELKKESRELLQEKNFQINI